MSPPSPYPRIPHLVPGRGTRDDRVLAPAEATSLLAGEVVVEEKLDGANASLWLEGASVQAALRSGPGSMDRAGQLGPLRAWVGHRHDTLAALLRGAPQLGPPPAAPDAEARPGSGLVLYAEWLYLSHTVAYDRLESLLVALDLRRADGSFLTVDQRDARCSPAGVALPPRLWRGVAHKVQVIDDLLGPSRHGPAPAEGVVVRPVDGSEPRVAKLVPAGFSPLADEEWARGRPHNRLRPRHQEGEERSWR